MSLGALGAIAYGILAIIGGGIGYAQVRSKASLISGLISGILLLLGGWLWLQGLLWGGILSLVVTLVLVGVFIGRLRKTGKFMPAGLMVGLGLLALALMAWALFSPA